MIRSVSRGRAGISGPLYMPAPTAACQSISALRSLTHRFIRHHLAIYLYKAKYCPVWFSPSGIITRGSRARDGIMIVESMQQEL